MHPSNMKIYRIFIFSLAFAGFLAVLPAESPRFSAAAAQARKLDFLSDIQPVFAARCYSCHGPAKQMARLRLDSRQSVFEGAKSGPAVVPGRAEESLLYQRVAGLNDLEQMPLGQEKLSAEQINLIRDWINQGANWPETGFAPTSELKKHWAYERPVRPPLPDVREKSWPRNPIDFFLLAALEEKGLAPRPQASKETLIRRVSLDLIGLPPSPEEVDAFLADNSPGAYDKVVDRLLASPHYGERWAVPWLDLARYADTHGYEKDRRRSIWLFRDWVIQALNADMPFNRFTVEQIAGDLLADSTLQQKIATGFHRNSMINEEGGTDPEEYRVAAVVDRVDTTAFVWLGTTLACARCHDHKFDPFSQEEYYRFYSFFNNTEDEVTIEQRTERRSGGPTLTYPSPSYLSSHRRALEDEIVELEKTVTTMTAELRASQTKWEREARAKLVTWIPLDPVSATSAGGATLTRLADNSFLAAGRLPDRDTYIVQARVALKNISGVRLEVLADPESPNSGAARSPKSPFILTGFEVEASPAHASSISAPAATSVPVVPQGGRNSERHQIVFASAAADTSRKGFSIKDLISGENNRGWSVEADNEEAPISHHAAFTAKQPFGYDSGTLLTIRLKQESSSPQQLLGRFRISITDGAKPERSVEVPPHIAAILALPKVAQSKEQASILEKYFLSTTPMLKNSRDRLAMARAAWNELSSPSTLVMRELSKGRESHVQVRGNFLTPGKLVTPGVPAVLHKLPDGQPLNRLALANWLVNEKNPLVARVTMNRIWMLHFGRGLVETPEDFGTRGQPPTNPALLDWLATEFVRQRWSMKAMHRLIVTSAAYRQNSSVTPRLLELDPYNRLISRGPRFRLDAEFTRDNALAIGGILSDRMYGPSVFPQQPEGTWNLVYNDDKWITSAGEDQYRRGLYTFLRRTAPYPSFLTFDATSRETTCTARVRTNTPLQSLITLNDPVFFAAARGLAKRMMTLDRETAGAAPANSNGISRAMGAQAAAAAATAEDRRTEIEQRVICGFRICLARTPDARELQRLVLLFSQELKHYRNDAKAALQLAGDSEIKLPAGADPAEFAAWTIVANVMLNLDETLSIG